MNGIIHAEFEGSATFAEQVYYETLKSMAAWREYMEGVEAFVDQLKADLEAGNLNGATFTPYITGDCFLYWTNDKGLPNPAPRNIKGTDGACFPKEGYFAFNVENNHLWLYYHEEDEIPDFAIEDGHLVIRFEE